MGNHDPQVSLGNIGDLVRSLRKLYPRHTPHIWLDELGYQTDPPDPYRGISPQEQAAYLAQAVRVARATPLVDELVWFMLRDETTTASPARAASRPAWCSTTTRRSRRSRSSPGSRTRRWAGRRSRAAWRRRAELAAESAA